MTAAFANVFGAALLHMRGSLGDLKEKAVCKFVRWRKSKLVSSLKEQAWKL